MTTTARDEVLARIRAALGDDPVVPHIPRDYRRHGVHPAGAPELVAQLVDRLEDYRATVVRIGTDDDQANDRDIGQAVADALAPREIGQAITPAGTPHEWTSWLADVIVDDGPTTATGLDATALDATALDAIPAVVTGSVVAVAETGTIILDGGHLCGRRAITLVPDVHVCIVAVDDVVQTVPEGLARLDPTRPLTLISGPSATSDIELNRVEGVHGPRTLIVIIAGGAGSGRDGAQSRSPQR